MSLACTRHESVERANLPPLVWAHRGSHGPGGPIENTLEAFARARSDGADGVELDVMRCASGEVVVFHDYDLARLAGRPHTIRETPWSELRGISFGDGSRIPLLVDVLDSLGPLACNVELKSAHAWGPRFVDDGLAGAVASLLSGHPSRSQILVSSFDPLLLLRFRRQLPTLPLALLFGAEQAWPFRRAWPARLVRPEAVHPEAALVDVTSMRRWRALGYRVNVWTVDEPAVLRWLWALGVDGVITNRPAVARRVFAELDSTVLGSRHGG